MLRLPLLMLLLLFRDGPRDGTSLGVPLARSGQFSPLLCQAVIDGTGLEEGTVWNLRLGGPSAAHGLQRLQENNQLHGVLSTCTQHSYRWLPS